MSLLVGVGGGGGVEGLGSARVCGNGVLVCPELKPLITLNNRLRLCLPRVRAKIISANISWNEGRKEGKNGGSGRKVIISLFYEGGRIQF